MKISSRNIINNWIILLVVMLLSFFLIGVYIMVNGNDLTRTANDKFYDYNIEHQKEQVKIEVQSRIDEIEYEREHLIEDEMRILYEKIHDIYNIMKASDLMDIEDYTERKEQALRYFEFLVDKDSDYLYFALATDGVMLRSGTDDEIEGTDLYEAQDQDGVYYIQNIIKAENVPDGLYTDYYWPKVQGGDPLKKTTYCFYMPEFDFIIATGSYHDDLQVALQETVYERLQSYYEDRETYIFVVDFDSTFRVANQKEMVGDRMDEAMDYEGESIHQKFMEAVAQGGGFASYYFYQKGSDVLSEKISYVEAIEGWDTYIGMGFYIDDLNNELNEFNDVFRSHHYNQVVYVILGLLLTAILMFGIFQRGAYLQRQFLKQGDVVFEQLFDLSNDAIVVVSSSGELLYENTIANWVFSGQKETFFAELSSSGYQMQRDVYPFTSDAGREYFFTIKHEPVDFQYQEGTIFFFHDITEQYVQENALKQLAYHDELTGLLNRRSFNNHYDDYTHNMSEHDHCVIAMIDIDKFKDVNDTFGHDKGDEVLKALADTFKHRLRNDDEIYRYGGEEFVVTLKGVTLEKAKGILENLNLKFYNASKALLPYGCTYSGGLVEVTFETREQHVEGVIKAADGKLYIAKQNGRNRIEY